MSIKYFFFNLILIIAIILLVASFLPVQRNGGKPEQATNPNTHFLVWHPDIPGYYGVEIPSMGLFSIVITAIGTVIGYIVAFRNGPKDEKHLSLFYTVDSHNNEVQEPIPTITFNRIIVLYNFATFGSAVIFFIYDASKIFVSIAILHNLFELIIILAIISGGKFSSVVEYILPILYVLIFGGISIFAEFPFDASFFKFQGLILDFALPIIFMNIYLNTRRNLHNDPNYSYSRSGGGSYAAASEEEEQLLGEESSEDNTRRHRQQVEIPVGKQPVRDEPSYKNDTINHPCQLLLLVVASLIHVIGNFVLTLVPFKIITNVFFEFTYCVAFSTYIFYVFLDVNSQSKYPTKRIYLSKFSFIKATTIFLASLFLALLSIRLFTLINPSTMK